ncbi:glucans biosynthesis protein [Salmonella enterica subsp. enterica]|uniref:Glucans biosynthesis protein n=1 Tax=Salmonella enterica I TaxID=59201 RepID=A0A3S4I1G4_SALET|nr:glucans biosynthesis protein [Salmonella enterica subsp. enterica]
MFNFIVMQTLFYVPFFILGALAFIHPDLKARFTTPSRGCTLGACRCFYRVSAESTLWERRRPGMYETESVITMVMGLWMVNVVFSLGHRFVKLSVRACHLFRECFAVYLSGGIIP